MPSSLIPKTAPSTSAARTADPRSESSKNRDLISRGDYTSTPFGKALFVALRTADVALQYSLLHHTGAALLGRLGLHALPPSIAVSATGIEAVDALGLSPARLVLLAMAAGSALKQSIWAALLSGEPMSIGNAINISAFNTIVNGVNALAYLWRSTSTSSSESTPLAQQPLLLLGAGLYTVGIFAELVSEVQRKRFKSDARNKGKPFTGGLWSWARHINYGGYTLWRAGYAVAGGGWVLGAIVGVTFFMDFKNRAVPILDEYCEKRYGEDWQAFKRQTRWRLIPGVY